MKVLASYPGHSYAPLFFPIFFFFVSQSFMGLFSVDIHYKKNKVVGVVHHLSAVEK